jgi:hypothetical protein
MKKYNQELKEFTEMLENGYIKGLLIACPSEEHDSAFGISGEPKELVANMALMLYHNPQVLQVFQTALQIAIKRLKDDYSDDVDKSRLN